MMKGVGDKGEIGLINSIKLLMASFDRFPEHIIYVYYTLLQEYVFDLYAAKAYIYSNPHKSTSADRIRFAQAVMMIFIKYNKNF